jgi:hypothetical protein
MVNNTIKNDDNQTIIESLVYRIHTINEYVMHMEQKFEDTVTGDFKTRLYDFDYNSNPINRLLFWLETGLGRAIIGSTDSVFKYTELLPFTVAGRYMDKNQCFQNPFCQMFLSNKVMMKLIQKEIDYDGELYNTYSIYYEVDYNTSY